MRYSKCQTISWHCIFSFLLSVNTGCTWKSLTEGFLIKRVGTKPTIVRMTLLSGGPYLGHVCQKCRNASLHARRLLAWSIELKLNQQDMKHSGLESGTKAPVSVGFFQVIYFKWRCNASPSSELHTDQSADLISVRDGILKHLTFT